MSKLPTAVQNSANNIQTPSFEEYATMRIDWRLLDACTYSCPDCDYPRSSSGSIFMREHLLAMVDRVLEIRSPGLIVNFTGGEPALHPFLPDILTKFSVLHRDIKIALHSNGSQSPERYLQLADRLRHNSFQFVLHAHPGISDPKSLFVTIAALAERGIHVIVNLHCHPEHKSEYNREAPLFSRLREHVVFDMRIAGTTCMSSSDADFLGVASPSTGAAASPLRPAMDDVARSRIDNYGEIAPLDNNALPEATVYCVTGVNYLRIEPDGGFYGAPCLKVSVGRPLWQLKPGSTVAFPQFRRCLGNCESCSAPRFTDEANAKSWIASFRDQVGKWAGEATHSLNPQPMRPDDALVVARRLQAFYGEGGGIEKECHKASLNGENLAMLGRISKACADELSRQILLGHARRPNVGATHTYSGESGIDASERRLDSEYLSDREFAIKWGRPGLRLFLADDDIPVLPARLLELNPAYSFRVSGRAGGVIFEAASPGCAIPLSRPASRNGITVAILNDGADPVERSVYSLESQNRRDLEIFIVNYGEGTKRGFDPENVPEYFDIRIHNINLRPNSTRQEALNAALLNMTGRYLAFMKAGEIAVSGYLNQALSFMEKNSLDLVSFQSIAEQKGNFFQTTAMEGVHDRKTGLELALTGRSGAPGLEGHIYDAAIIDKYDLRFGAAMPEWLFNILFINYSTKLGIKTLAGVITSQKKLASSLKVGNFAEFCEVAAFMGANFREDGIDVCYQSAWSAFDSILEVSGDSLALEICQSLNSPKKPVIFDGAALRKAGSSHALVGLLLEQYSHAYCARRNTHTHVEAADMDWRKAASRPPASKSWKMFESDPLRNHPELTVVIPNYNKIDHIAACLDSVLSQEASNFEVVIVDDHSTDGSYELLEAYALSDARIRLFRMDENCRQGVCRNLGIDQARGEFIIFVDSDDRCESGFFSSAIRAMKETGADVVIFSIRHVNLDGEVTWENQLKDGIESGVSAMNNYFNNKYEPAPWGKIFRASTVAKSGARFSEYVYHQDVPFFCAVLEHSNSVASRGRFGYRMVRTASSTMRPASATWLHAHSSCVFLDFIQKLHDRHRRDEEIPLLQAVKFNLEYVLLDKINAFINACGEIPLSTREYEMISSSPLFMRALAQGWAESRLSSDCKPVEKPRWLEALENAQAGPWDIGILVSPDDAVYSPIQKGLFPYSGLKAVFLYTASADQDVEWYMDIADAPFLRINGNAEDIPSRYFSPAAESALAPEALLAAKTLLDRRPDLDLVLLGYEPGFDGSLTGSGFAEKIASGEMPLPPPARYIFRSSFISQAGVKNIKDIANSPGVLRLALVAGNAAIMYGGELPKSGRELSASSYLSNSRRVGIINALAEALPAFAEPGAAPRLLLKTLAGMPARSRSFGLRDLMADVSRTGLGILMSAWALALKSDSREDSAPFTEGSRIEQVYGSDSTAPLLTLVIAAQDGESLLHTLSSLRLGPLSRIEVIAIDCQMRDWAGSEALDIIRNNRGWQLWRGMDRLSDGQAVSLAVPLASGEWVGFLQAGDVIDADSLKRLGAALQTCERDIMLAGQRRTGGRPITIDYRQALRLLFTERPGPDVLYRREWFQNASASILPLRFWQETFAATSLAKAGACSVSGIPLLIAHGRSSLAQSVWPQMMFTSRMEAFKVIWAILEDDNDLRRLYLAHFLEDGFKRDSPGFIARELLSGQPDFLSKEFVEAFGQSDLPASLILDDLAKGLIGLAELQS